MTTHKTEGVLAIVAALLVLYISSWNTVVAVGLSAALFVLLAAWLFSKKD